MQLCQSAAQQSFHRELGTLERSKGAEIVAMYDIKGWECTGKGMRIVWKTNSKAFGVYGKKSSRRRTNKINSQLFLSD